jgi:hypothetical protein
MPTATAGRLLQGPDVPVALKSRKGDTLFTAVEQPEPDCIAAESAACLRVGRVLAAQLP